jgi:hypothetical protein
MVRKMELNANGETERGEPLTIACALLVAITLAVVAASFNAFAAIWGVHAVPKGDLCIIETNVRQAIDFKMLTGMYSRFGWHHPGPA